MYTMHDLVNCYVSHLNGAVACQTSFKLSQARKTPSKMVNTVIFGRKSFFSFLVCGVFARVCGVFARDCGVFARVPESWFLVHACHLFFHHILARKAQMTLVQLQSRTHSSETLLRGTAMVRENSMSLDHDEEYQQMVRARQALMDT